MSDPTIELPAYPGRGVAVHRHHDGRIEWLYFLTGRSDASRERALQASADRVAVVPTGDGARDPLRHYSCVRVVGPTMVIGNGDHVDQLAEGLQDGRPLAEMVADLDPEPDPPIHTARIAVVAVGNASGTSASEPTPVQVVSVRAAGGTTERTVESFPLAAGEGVLLHTYGGGTTDVIPDARPRRFDAGGPGTDVAGRLWHALDPELRVALAVGLVPDAVPTRVLTERRYGPDGRPTTAS